MGKASDPEEAPRPRCKLLCDPSTKTSTRLEPARVFRPRRRLGCVLGGHARRCEQRLQGLEVFDERNPKYCTCSEDLRGLLWRANAPVLPAHFTADVSAYFASLLMQNRVIAEIEA